MIGADRLTAHFAERMNTEWLAGRRVEAVLLDAHAAYARDHAEVVFLRATDPIYRLRAAEHNVMAAAAQIAAVTRVNAFFYGDNRDLAFDERCRIAVAQGFWARLAGLQIAAGVRR